MELIIIGVYDEEAHARSAKNDLIASGFPRGSVQINPDHEAAAAAPAREQKGVAPGGRIGDVFRSLFSMDDPYGKSSYSNLYSEAVRRGGFVVTVDVDNDGERTRAEEIMRRHGPVDIEERSGEWARHGWRGHDPATSGATLRAFLRRREPPERK